MPALMFCKMQMMFWETLGNSDGFIQHHYSHVLLSGGGNVLEGDMLYLLLNDAIFFKNVRNIYSFLC